MSKYVVISALLIAMGMGASCSGQLDYDGCLKTKGEFISDTVQSDKSRWSKPPVDIIKKFAI